MILACVLSVATAAETATVDAASGSSACWRSFCTSMRPCASHCRDASSGRSEPKHACNETARCVLVPPAAYRRPKRPRR